MIGGLQGIVDHVMVGHYVGYTGNAAIGVGWQIFLVVVVFISSLYTGMGVLVARFAGANDSARVNRVVYQAFLTSIALSLGILAPLGYVLSPQLLQLIHAAPEVRAAALPYLRTMFLCSLGQLLYFMLAGALRAAGDARTPLRIGLSIIGLNIALNMVLIRGLGPIPGFGAQGAALGTSIASFAASACRHLAHGDGPGRRALLARNADGARLDHHPIAVSFRAARRRAGRGDERRRRASCCASSARCPTAPKRRPRMRSATRSSSRSSRGRRSA